MTRPVTALERAIPGCRRCPELRRYCVEIGREKRRAFEDWDYWAKPVAGFGDRRAKLVIVGLAPGAHGANRTGRIFTGDRSGDFLYAALHRAGLASQAESTHRADGMKLRGAYISAALRCAPPGNRPTPRQLDNCRPWLVEELEALRPRAALCLGGIAWKAALDALAGLGRGIPRPKPKFGHGQECEVDGTVLVGAYHVSQQNTFTRRLTESMFDEVLSRAKEIARCASS